MNKIPKWVIGYAIFLLLLSFGAGFTAMVAPASLFTGSGIDFAPIQGIMMMFGGRNVAFGVIAIMALNSRNPHYLLALYAGRFVVELFDLYAAMALGLTMLPAGVVLLIWLPLFLLPEGLAIVTLRRLVKG